MAHFAAVLSVLASMTVLAYSIPAINSTTLHQNALNAQVLNSEFHDVQDTDACNSGQTACVCGALAVCKFGSWQTTGCGDSKECFAVPATTGPGTNLICTSQTSAMSMFQAAGLDGLYNNSSETVAFPTTSQSAAPTTPSSVVTSQTDDVQVVTVTVTLPVLSISTNLPTETRTIDPAEAASILSSISAKDLIATSAQPSRTEAVAPSSTPIGHCQQTASGVSVIPSATSAPSDQHGYSYHKRSRVAFRA